jgi:hypothetical protein
MDIVKNIVDFLQIVGCKIYFDSDGIKFSEQSLISKTMLNKIHKHEDEIKQYILDDISTMSVSINNGAVGSLLKKSCEKFCPLEKLDSISKEFDKLDAKGINWCDQNKAKIAQKIVGFAVSNNIDYDYKKCYALVKKSISDARKSIIS